MQGQRHPVVKDAVLVGTGHAHVTVLRKFGMRPPGPYDLLSLNIGSTPNTNNVPGAHEHAIPVKPIDGFLRRLNELKARIIARQGRARIAVFGGGGAAGAELILSVASRMRQEVARAQCLRVSTTTPNC